MSDQFDSKTDFGAFKTYTVEPTNSPTLALRVLDGKPMTQVVQGKEKGDAARTRLPL